ncbi:CRISPR system precrRNA processing endoribonuclease RAMP protein Cas6 [Thermovibrio sp.]
MPLKLLLKFKLSKPVKVKEVRPKFLHGLLFSFFKKEPKVGELLHESRLKPFSISAPYLFKDNEREVKSLYFTLSLLNGELYPKVSRFLFFAGSKELFMGKVKVEHLFTKPLEVKSYRELYQEAPPKREIVLDFISPTSFKRRSWDYPLPEPKLVFLSLFKKWNSFSPVKLERRVLEEALKRLTISGCWIKTKKVEVMENSKFTGFVGRVFFYGEDLKEEEAKTLNALKLLAPFSGVGRKTTMAMGSVRIPREVVKDDNL